jgi:hypothetical protein
MALLTSDLEFHSTARGWELRNYPSVPGHLGTVELEISEMSEMKFIKKKMHEVMVQAAIWL